MIQVILPAYNEEKLIGKVIDEIKSVIECDIIVADSKSTDLTAAIALAKGVKVISCSRGKGKAIREVFDSLYSRKASLEFADYVFMLDSDYTYPARYIKPMLDLLEGGKLIPQFDAVCGWRKNKEIGSMTRLHKIGNAGLTILANFLYSPPWIDDLCTGMWGFSKETVKFLNRHLSSDGFTLEADIYLCLAKAHKSLGCVEIDYRPRIGEKAKLKYKDAFKIANFLVKSRIH